MKDPSPDFTALLRQNLLSYLKDEAKVDQVMEFLDKTNRELFGDEK